MTADVKLLAELDRLAHLLGNYDGDPLPMVDLENALLDAAKALRAQSPYVEDDARDAARYRYLRENGEAAQMYIPSTSGFGTRMVIAHGTMLDAAIDEEISKSSISGGRE